MHDDHPELAGADDDRRPVRSPAWRHVMRIVVVIGLIALVVPGVLTTVSTQLRTAEAACGVVVASRDPEAVDSEPRFEMLGPDGPNWYCYSVHFDGSEVLLRSIGLIPGLRWQPDGQPA